jgi:hypothetical protein
MRPDDRVRIRHMIEAAEAAQRFIANRQRADLDTDEMLLFALVRAAEIIGEAASKALAKNDGYSDAPLSPPLMCSSKTGGRLFGTSTVHRSRFAAGCGQDWRID